MDGSEVGGGGGGVDEMGGAELAAVWLL